LPIALTLALLLFAGGCVACSDDDGAATFTPVPRIGDTSETAGPDASELTTALPSYDETGALSDDDRAAIEAELEAIARELEELPFPDDGDFSELGESLP
jgi:hypothetical protein